jgi:hypothetical protein
VTGAIKILGHGVRADREPGMPQECADHFEVALHLLLVDLLQRGIPALRVRGGASEPGVVKRRFRLGRCRRRRRLDRRRFRRRCLVPQRVDRLLQRLFIESRDDERGLVGGGRFAHGRRDRLAGRMRFGAGGHGVGARYGLRSAFQPGEERWQERDRLGKRREHAGIAFQRAFDDPVQQIFHRPREIADAPGADHAAAALQRVECAPHPRQ